MLTDRDVGQVVIPMIAFIKGGMVLPMRRITQDYLFNHRLTPHQCAPNMFRVLGSIDVLNERIGLGLTWHDVVHMYECHHLDKARYYLKSRSEIIRLISCLPKSNKGMKDDYLIALGEWIDGFHCLTRTGDPGAVSLRSILRERRGGLALWFYFLLVENSKFCNLTKISFSAILQIGHTSPLGSAT